MPLSFEEFKKLRASGLSIEQIKSFEAGETPQTLQQKKQIDEQVKGNQFVGISPNKGQTAGQLKGIQKVLGFTGGGKLAEGAGMALAAPGIQKNLNTSNDLLAKTQDDIIQKIKEKRARGEDYSRLQAVLKESIGFNRALSDASQDFVEALPTNKQVIGSATRLGTTLGAGGITRGVAQVTGLGKTASFIPGFIKGGATGALSGGIVGGLEGGGLAAEQNKSATDIAKYGAIGAGGGALFGGVLGSVAGGTSAQVRHKALTKQNFVEDYVAPKATDAVRQEAIARGELIDPTLLNKARLATSKRTTQLADSVRDVVKRGASTSQNVSAIRGKINQTDKAVEAYVKANKVPFNGNQLRTQLETGKDELELVFASDKNAEKTYDAVVRAFLKQIEGKDTAGLLRARKDFDKLPAIRKLLNTDRIGENARREIVLAVRESANKYTASLLPQSNTFRADLLKQHYMIEAVENIADKATGEVGLNKLQLFAKKYPVGKVAIGAALGLGIAGGGAAIGSSGE